MVSLVFCDLLLCALVCCAILVLPFFRLAAFIKVSAHLACQFDAYHIRWAIGADDRIDNLDGLRYCSADYWICDFIHIR